MALRRSVLSRVIDTEVSEVVTTSIEVWCRSKTSNIVLRNPWAMIIWVEATFNMVTPRLTAIDLIVLRDRLGSAAIRVPSHEGLFVLKMCTGILRSMAGSTVLG